MNTMTPQHENWTEFYNLLSGHVTDHGCDHGTKWSTYALRAMGFTEEEIKASLAGFAEAGGYCDCEILMNLAGEPGTAQPEPKTRCPAKGFDLEQHEAFGRILAGISGFLNRLSAQLERAYRGGGHHAGFARHLVDQLRAALSLRAQAERPADDRAGRLYYPVTSDTPSAKPIDLADLQKCLGCDLGEGAYRRGVSQALSLAGGLVRAGATADDLDRLTDLSMDFRYDHKPHPAYLDDLQTAWRRGEQGKTGIDPRLLGTMLQQTERDKGGRPAKTSSAKEPVSVAKPTLADLNISKKERPA